MCNDGGRVTGYRNRQGEYICIMMEGGKEQGEYV